MDLGDTVFTACFALRSLTQLQPLPPGAMKHREVIAPIVLTPVIN